MRKHQQMVQQFHEKSGAVVNHKPIDEVDIDTQMLRISLMQEELDELDEAMENADTTGIADAIGDLLYVVLGTAVTYGIDIEPIFEEIHRSNMTKFIDGHKRADGKWIKGPSYTPAQLKPILDHQRSL